MKKPAICMKLEELKKYEKNAAAPDSIQVIV